MHPARAPPVPRCRRVAVGWLVWQIEIWSLPAFGVMYSETSVRSDRRDPGTGGGTLALLPVRFRCVGHRPIQCQLFLQRKTFLLIFHIHESRVNARYDTIHTGITPHVTTMCFALYSTLIVKHIDIMCKTYSINQNINTFYTENNLHVRRKCFNTCTFKYTLRRKLSVFLHR